MKKNAPFVLMLVSFFFFSCSNQYKIVRNSEIKFSKAYFQKYVAGVKGGGAGLSLTLVLENDIDLESRKIEILGIYYHNSFGKLKFQGSNKFQAFLKTDANNTKILLENEEEVEEVKSTKAKIPFDLKDKEAIISYKIRNKQEYMKLILTEKVLKNYPM